MTNFLWVLGIFFMVIGLAMIGFVLLAALNRNVLEAGVVSFPAAIVFRAGVGLFRMSTASRIALKLHEADRR